MYAYDVNTGNNTDYEVTTSVNEELNDQNYKASLFKT